MKILLIDDCCAENYISKEYEITKTASTKEGADMIKLGGWDFIVCNIRLCRDDIEKCINGSLQTLGGNHYVVEKIDK